jgi:hypothetical protein
VSQLELAGPLLPRLVRPHEFQRHPLPRPCLAVEDDQGAGGSLAAEVDGLRQLGLAHLLFASQQDGALSLAAWRAWRSSLRMALDSPTRAESSGTVWRS